MCRLRAFSGAISRGFAPLLRTFDTNGCRAEVKQRIIGNPAEGYRCSQLYFQYAPVRCNSTQRRRDAFASLHIHAIAFEERDWNCVRAWCGKVSKNERAAQNIRRLFLRENSSNGGKAIRTFWVHSRCGWRRCQGKIRHEISTCISFTYNLPFHRSRGNSFPLYSPFTFCILPC
jgi:hypothetical protein